MCIKHKGKQQLHKCQHTQTYDMQKVNRQINKATKRMTASQTDRPDDVFTTIDLSRNKRVKLI